MVPRAAVALSLAWSLTGHLALAQDDGDGDGDGEAAATLDAPAQGDAPSPWSEGVSPEDQAEALRLFGVGNAALDDGDFSGAEESFAAALERWNHPAIQYNLVLALIGKKGDPVRIYKALQEATRFGDEPLEPALYARAEEYMGIYIKQLASLEIVCDEPGAKVTLDGKLVFTGPGRFKDMVPAGEHAITATKPEYIAINKILVLNPEDTERLTLRMFTLEDRTRYTRRWSAWVPWTMALGGAAVLGAGGGLQYLANQNDTAFNELLAEQCPDGCEAGEVDTSQRDRADQQTVGAYICYGLGGAAVTAGVIMIFLNQPKKVVDLGEDESQLSVLPMVAPGRVGISAALRF